MLSGAAEAPPNGSLGTGTTTVTIDTVAHTLEISADFADLTGLTTAAHIHCCTAVPGAGLAGVATETPSFASFPLGVQAGSFTESYDLTEWRPSAGGSWRRTAAPPRARRRRSPRAWLPARPT